MTRRFMRMVNFCCRASFFATISIKFGVDRHHFVTPLCWGMAKLLSLLLLQVILLGGFCYYYTDSKKSEEIEMLQSVLNQEQEQKTRLSEELKKARENLEKSEQKQQEIQKQWDAYRDKYRMTSRQRAVGEKHELLTKVSGETFAKAVILKVDEVYVHFSHDRGVAKLPIADFGAEWTDRFDCDQASARDLSESGQQQKLPAADKVKNNPDLENHKEPERDLAQVAIEKKLAQIADKRAELHELLKQRKISVDASAPELFAESQGSPGQSFDLPMIKARRLAQEINQLKMEIELDR